MPSYIPPLKDMKFILHDLLGTQELCNLGGYEDFSPVLIDQIIEESGQFCADVFFPLNQSGDQEGCLFDQGGVGTPSGFKEAYDSYVDAGWTTLACDPAYGGMGAPQVVNAALKEMISSANMSLGMYPGLSYGTYEALYYFGNEALKKLYLPPLVEGRWAGSMCMSEAQAGSDLGLISTKARENEDGSYSISGTKIFITSGEHDLTENIVHMVLARIEGAPEGTRGLSLFLVPKIIPNEDGSLGSRNGVVCTGIEHKMGIRGSSTCILNFDEAQGWLVGRVNRGLIAMFSMMNDARFGVALQGLGMAEIAQQNAFAYAKERLQMRALSGAAYPEKAADPILLHPDVRRMLLIGKAFTEGARALALWIAKELDISRKSSDQQRKAQAEDLVALMIPVMKAYFTDMGSEVTNLAVQVYGGAGYIAEQGVEQYVRDARVAQIYEGTNGIQALDLVGHKMVKGKGRLPQRFFELVQQFIDDNSDNEALGEFIAPLHGALNDLQVGAAFIQKNAAENSEELGAASSDYLRQFALVSLGFMWCQMAKVAQQKLNESIDDKDFYEGKLKTARFFIQRMLPEAKARHEMVLAGAETLMNSFQSEL